jgi:ABC-2 type transport system ATP-binding protein
MHGGILPPAPVTSVQRDAALARAAPAMAENGPCARSALAARRPATPMHDPIVSVRDLVFDYPTQRALHGISLDVPANAVLALVGPNGAGKSTLMRVIAGLEEPVAGSVRVDGIDVLGQPRRAQATLGYLGDFFGLYDELTVRRCLLHAAGIRGVPGALAGAAADRAARRVGIEARMGDAAGSLSRGLRQRLAIAQALVHDPAILLLDEPAAGLDPEARAALSAQFRALRAEGKTLIVSSHILAELEEYSTHMLALRAGRVIEFSEIAVSGIGGLQRLRIRLAHAWTAPPGFWQAQGAGLRGVSGEGEPHEIRLDMPGGVAGAARLVKALVEAGAPLAEIAPHQENLQESYLRAARAHANAQEDAP